MTEEEKTILYSEGRYYEIVIDRETNRIISMRPIDATKEE